MPGKLWMRHAGGGERTYALSGGFLEVAENQAVILADSLEDPATIDVDRARRAAERARERLQDRASSWDADRAERALRRAINRITLAGGGRH